MKLVFWLSVAGIFYTYAGYPLIIRCLARIFPRPIETGKVTPGVSIVMAVRNGSDLLRAKIQHLLTLDYPGVREVIVVSDGSTDKTEEVLAEVDDPRFYAILLPEHQGKAAALNAGVARASSEVVVFVDIRPRIAPGAIQALVSNFADPSVGCVAGELYLQAGAHDSTTAAIGGLYWRYEQWIRKSESAYDSPVGVYGGFYAARRKLVARQPDGLILDDMFQPLSIIRQGYRSVLEPQAKVVDQWPVKTKGEFQRKVRTLVGNFQLFQMAPWSLGIGNRVLFQFLSHKVLRLLVPYLFALSLIAAGALAWHSGFYSFITAAQVLVWTAALASLRFEIPILNRFCAPAGALLVLNVAAVVGFYKFLMARGPLWKIWEIQAPARGELDSAA